MLVQALFSLLGVAGAFAGLAETSFYDPSRCPTYWPYNDGFGPPSGVDDDPTTFIHTSISSSRNFYLIDLQEPRAVTRIRLQSRPDCCWDRDNYDQFWIGNNPSDPTAAGNVQCTMPPPFTDLSTWRESACIRGNSPSRYVFVLLDCNGATPCIMNWASVEVYGYAPSWPVVYKEVAQGKPADTITAYGGGVTTDWAGYATDGNLNTITHTGTVPQSVLWWRVDLGSYIQPIDRVWRLNRPHYINCIRYWQRDQGQDIAVSNSTSDLTFDGATPAANKCGTTDDPSLVPWQWEQVGCGARLGRFVWIRGVKGFTNSICRLDMSYCWTGENYIHHSELQVYSSSCPSMRNMVPTPASTNFVDEFSSGCGAAGSVSTSYAWTGSRCVPTCAAGYDRVRGGAFGITSECRSGEWVDLRTRTAAGPLICGKMCPAIPAPPLMDTSSCTQIVADLNFDVALGTMQDWWPVFKVFKTTTAAAAALYSDLGTTISYPEMEIRARYNTSRLWLSGRRTLWGLNNPMWADAAQMSSSLTITVDVALDTPTTVAGLALRISAGEPASFYLLRLRYGTDSHRFFRVDAGVEVDLGGTRTGLCNVATSAFRRVKFTHAGTTLRAFCDGVDIGSVTDASANRLLTGGAGLWNDRGPDFNAASGSSIITFYDNLLIERGCDGADGGCSAAAPGESCAYSCQATLSQPATGTSPRVNCRADGTWDAAALQCSPNIKVTGPFEVAENSPARTNVGVPIALAASQDGVTLNYTVVSAAPANAPFTIGACDGQVKVSRSNSLDYEAGPRSYTLVISVAMSGPGISTTSTQTIGINVLDVPEAPILPATSMVSLPENATVGVAYDGIFCNDVDGFPLTAAITVNAPGGLFNITRSVPGAATMPDAGRFSLVTAVSNALDYERYNSYSLIVTCTDATGLSATAVVQALITNVQEPPVWFPAALNVSIQENATLAMTASPALSAWDPENSTLIYSLADGFVNQHFTVSSVGNVVVKAGAALDYETVQLIALQVKVTDDTGLSAVATCWVQILNVNEPPVFPNQTRVALETAQPFDAVGLPLVASDPEDKNLIFSIYKQPTPGLFIADSPSGQLRLGNTNAGSSSGFQLDFFTTPFYTLGMSVADAGTPDGRVTIVNATVNITVQWVNRPPVIVGPLSCNVSEGAALATAVCDIVATDRDARAPIFDRLTYTIPSQEPTAAGDVTPFAISAGSSRIVVGAQTGLPSQPARLDLATKRTYSLVVQATDASGASTTAPLTVRLLNVNNAPSLPSGLVFPAKSRAAQIVGTALSALVQDPDLAAGVGERFTFSIVGGNNDTTFAIDSATGQISVAAPNSASFYTGSVYALQVRVQDAGIDGPVLSATTVISIPVIDNNNSPSCAAVNGVVFSVAERAANGLEIGIVTCTDPDLPQQSITYRLDSAGGNINRPFPFRIVTANNVGHIIVDTVTAGNGPIDFEGLFARYNATVTVVDNHPVNPLSATAAIGITVTDVPEAPYYAVDDTATGNPGVPGKGVFNLTLPENSRAGIVLTGPALTARDQDAADGAGTLLQYSWAAATPSADAALFSLSPTTGVVTVASALSTPAAAAAALDFETRPVIKLFVQARDVAGNTDIALVWVTLSDINELPYMLSPPLSAAYSLLPTAGPLSIPENAPAGAQVGSVRGADQDRGLAGALTYAINGSVDKCSVNGFAAGVFAINPINGTISVANPTALDWEDCTSYVLSVTLTDGGMVQQGGTIAPGLITVVSVSVTVLDAPDSVIIGMRLAAGEEAAGRGVDLQDQFSPLAPLYPVGAGVSALFSTSGGGKIDITGTGFGATANRIAKEGAAPALTIAATFGPAGSIGRYSSPVGSCVIKAPNTVITCPVPAGVGANHEWQLLLNGQAFRSGATLTSFIPPAILNVSKQAGSGASDVLLSTRGGESLTVFVKNAGPVGTVVILTYGSVVDRTVARPAFSSGPLYVTDPCTWAPSGAYVACATREGYGKDLGFQLTVDGQTSPVFVTTFVAYAPPALTAVAAPGLLDTRGGALFNLSGTNLGPAGTPVLVRYSMGFLPAALLATAPATRPAANLFPTYTALQCGITTAHTVITCRAAEGVGAPLYMKVAVGAQESLPATGVSVSYRAPVILGVGGLGAVGGSTRGGGEVLLTTDFAGPATAVDTEGKPTDAAAMTGYSIPLAMYGKRPAGASAGPVGVDSFAGVLNATGLRYLASNCRVTVAHTTVTCTLVEGTGAANTWSLVVGGQASAYSTNTTSYAPPTVAAYFEKGASDAATAGSDVVEISGANMGPLGTPVESATYGKGVMGLLGAGGAAAPVNGSSSPLFTAVNCSVITAHERIRCRVAPGAGKDLSWSVVIDGQRSVFPTTQYRAPAITGLSGAGAPGWPDASTEGGQTFNVTGTDFAWGSFLEGVTFGPTGAEYPALDCRVVVQHTVVTCITPPGTGRKMPLQVQVYGQRSAQSVVTLSYERPRITSVQPSSPGLGFTSGGAIVTVSGTGLALRSTRSTLSIYLNTGYAPSGAPLLAASKPAQADMDRYWNAVQAGDVPPPDVRDAVQAWMALLARPAVLTSSPATGSVTFQLPPGYGRQRELFVSVDGILSDVWRVDYSPPAATNAAIDRRETPVGFAKLIVDGDSFCRDAACGTLFVNDTPVAAGNWTHRQIATVIALPVEGVRTPVYVSVDGARSNIVTFMNPAPVFPSNLGDQRVYADMLTQGGQPLIIDNVAELTMVPDDTITIQIGEARNMTCRNVTKTFQSGADVHDPLARWRLSGLTPEGVGAGLPIYVRVQDTLSPRSDFFSFSYAPPSLTSLSLMPAGSRLLQQGNFSAAGGSNSSLTIGVGGADGMPCHGQRVTLRGANLGTAALTTAEVIVVLPLPAPGSGSAGGTPGDNPAAARLLGSISIVSHTHTEMILALPPGQGFGLQMYLRVGGQMSQTPLSWGYRWPTIASVTPEVAPTSGGSQLTIEGIDWGVTDHPVVTVGAKPCPLVGAYTATPAATQSTLVCLLPSGVGANLPVVVAVGGQASPVLAAAQRFSYAAPVISAVLPPTGPTSGRDEPTELVSKLGTVSYLPGARRVMSLEGDNFGGPETVADTRIDFIAPFVLAGGQAVIASVNTSDIINKTHTAVFFYMPEGAGFELSVRLTVAGQQSAPGAAATFSYNAPEVRSWRRSDRPPTACLPFSRCLEVSATRVADLLRGAAANNASLFSAAGQLLPSAGEVAVAPGISLSAATAPALASNGSVLTVCRLAPSGCYDTRGGYPLEILGSSFGGSAVAAVAGSLAMPRVTIGGMLCPLLDATTADHNRVVCMAPAGMGDQQPIVVTVLGRSSPSQLPAGSAATAETAPWLFVYDPPEVLSTSPSTPDATGGKVQLKGRNFGLQLAPVAVSIGGLPCDEGAWLNDNLLSCTMQATTVGPKNISVLAANRTQPYVVYDFELAALVTECRRGLYGLETEVCVKCDYGGVCPGGEQEVDLLTSDAGMWRTNLSMTDVGCHLENIATPLRQPWGCPKLLACEPPEACLPGNVCDVPYTGERCQLCSKGFFRSDGACIRCPDSLPLIICIVVVALAACAGFAWWFQKKGLSVSLVSIFLDYAQVIAIFARSKVRWPPAIRQLLRIFSAFNLNLDIVAPECLSPSLRYWQKWLGIEALPLIFVSMFAIVVGCKLLYKVMCLNKSKDQLMSHLPGLVATSILIFRVMYLYLTRTSTEPMTCVPTTPPDGNTYILGDLTLPCWQAGSQQVFLFPAALSTLLLYTITLPIASWWHMRKNRYKIAYDQILRCRGLGNSRLETPYYTFRRTWSKAYAAFKPRFWFYEYVILARKASLAMVTLAFRSSASYQLSMALLILFIAFVVESHLLPYLSHSARQRVLEEHYRSVLTDPEAAKMDAEMRAYEAKNTRKGYRAQQRLFSVSAVAKTRLDAIALQVVDYNTVEGVMLAGAILVSIAAMMLDSSRFTGLTAEFYQDEYTSLTAATIVLIALTVIYWVCCFITDMLLVLAPDTAARVCVCGSKLAGLRDSPAAKRQPIRKGVAASAAGAAVGSRLPSLGAHGASGAVEMSLNPYLTNQAMAGQGPAIGASDVTAIAGAPDELTWSRIKASYLSLSDIVGRLQSENRSLQRQLANAAASDGAELAGSLKGDRTRREFNPLLATEEAELATAGGAQGAGLRSARMSRLPPIVASGGAAGTGAAAKQMAVFRGTGVNLKALKASIDKDKPARPTRAMTKLVDSDDEDDSESKHAPRSGGNPIVRRQRPQISPREAIGEGTGAASVNPLQAAAPE